MQKIQEVEKVVEKMNKVEQAITNIQEEWRKLLEWNQRKQQRSQETRIKVVLDSNDLKSSFLEIKEKNQGSTIGTKQEFDGSQLYLLHDDEQVDLLCGRCKERHA